MELSSYDLQKYALSGKMTRIKVVGVYLYKGLFFGELNLESHLKVNIEFLNGNFFDSGKGREIFKYVVMLVIKVTLGIIWRSN